MDKAMTTTEYDFITVYMTAENEDTATHIATTLVREKLIACANIQSPSRSIFEWNGTLELASEVLVLMKSRAEKGPAIIKRIETLHNYDVPCITILPIIDGCQSYFDWIDKQIS